MGHLDKKRSNVGKFIMLIYIKLTVNELLIGFNYKYRNPSKNVHPGIVFDVYDKKSFPFDKISCQSMSLIKLPHKLQLFAGM
jgi:hypothetical protein